MVGDMSHVTLNFDLSKIPYAHFLPGSRPILTPKIKHVHFIGSHLRAVTDADDDDNDDADADNAVRDSTVQPHIGRHIANLSKHSPVED